MLAAMMMSKFHGPVKTEGAVAFFNSIVRFGAFVS